MKLRGEQGQSLMQPYGAEKNQNDDGKLQKKNNPKKQCEAPESIRLLGFNNPPELVCCRTCAGRHDGHGSSRPEEAEGSRGRTGKMT